MSIDESGPFARETLGERLAAARWILLAGGLGLAVAVVQEVLAPGPALILGAVILVAACVPAGRWRLRRPVAAALSRFREPPAPPPDRLASLVGALPEAALLLDHRGTVRATNSRASGMLAAVRVGDPVSFAVRVPEVLEAIRAASADGQARRVEFSQRVPVDRWLRADIVPVMGPGGNGGRAEKVESLLLTFTDLTPQRRVEQMRVDFIANASHELRTPLASLSGFIETLQGPARNDVTARERFLKIMAEQARRMSRLIDDLLSLSRIELNAHLRPQARIDLVAVVGHVREALAPLGAERQLEIAFHHADASVMVLGDRDELIRVFENLVENALKYGASGGRVDITLSRDGDDALVAVRDYGPGIAPEHVPRLTERFYRVDTAHSREQGGTGLGLAIVKHIVARHRGRLGIDSTPGEGSTFSVRLAALPAEVKKISVKSIA
ncbi:two-component system phosphate regulon sensor histidine kinase PhoR [Ancylobacter sp. 3268]|uniref:ATP-binding protein n=1 Tax=Ancylobacter sp. 3268 TaxID=2817752 RepID=UPI002854D723|nr:ATP-binding protein [Ancylobacter sp. 3268]MDR6953508.1 two-component system phosphate regulon sensor histidine kinase PhoR [Ancylobacter sp. 3268]